MVTLVTGGTGFIGSNIVKTLARRGHKVVCFDLVLPDDLVKPYLAPWAESVTYVQGDLLNQEHLERVAEHGITKIVHAAVFTGILPDIEAGQGRSMVDINVMGTTNVLELARKVSPERFLYVSSGAVYGVGRSPDEVLREESPLRPHNLYAITKYASELLTRRYGELYGFQSVSVRLGGPYGPMERVTGHRANQSLMKEWTGRAFRGEAIEVDDRTRRQEVTYVTDIAGGIAAVLDAPSLSYDVYNNTSGQRSTLGDLIAVLEELHPGLKVIEVPSSEQLRVMVQGRENTTDVSRLRDDVGFDAQFDLAAGLTDYLAWRQAHDFTD